MAGEAFMDVITDVNYVYDIGIRCFCMHDSLNPCVFAMRADVVPIG